MVNQLASDINDAEEAELRRMEGGAPGSASSHQPPPPTKRPRTAPQQATTDELFIELVSWDPVGMPAGGDKAEVIASMLDNFAKCMADNAALLRQLHGRAQNGVFPGLASEGALQQAQRRRWARRRRRRRRR